MTVKLSKHFSVSKDTLRILSDVEMADIDTLTTAIGADSNNGFQIFSKGRLVGYASDIRNEVIKIRNANSTKSKENAAEDSAQLLQALNEFIDANSDFEIVDNKRLKNKQTGRIITFVLSTFNKFTHSLHIPLKFYKSRQEVVNYLIDNNYTWFEKANHNNSLLVRPVSIADGLTLIRELNTFEMP